MDGFNLLGVELEQKAKDAGLRMSMPLAKAGSTGIRRTQAIVPG